MNKGEFDSLYNSKTQQMKEEQKREKEKIEQKKEKEQEELQKEKKAKEEERFLNEQRTKVNRLVSEINFYLKQIKIIEESLQNQTDRKIIKAETDKINNYSRIIEKYKQELEKIKDSIIISNGSLVGDSVVRDSNIIEFFIEQARELRESIEYVLNLIPELEELEGYKYIDEKGLAELKKTAGNATQEEINQITGFIGSKRGYIKTGDSWIINQRVRKGKESGLSQYDNDTINALKSVTTTNYTNQNLILDRYVDKGKNQGFLKIFNIYYNGTNGQEIVNKLNSEHKNFIVKNRGFVSASYNREKNKFKNTRVVKLRILTPKGTNLYLIENVKESEVIFPFDVQFQHINFKLVYINGIEQIEITLKVVK